MEKFRSIFSNFSEEELELLKKCKAKTEPDKSIYDHSLECYGLSIKILEKIFIPTTVVNKIETQTNKTKTNIIREVIKDACAFHVFLHDLGKSDARFQEEIDRKIKPSTPHALLSLEKAKKKLIEKMKEYDIDEEQKGLLVALALLSIASHHSDYHADLYKDYKNKYNTKDCYEILKESRNYLDEVIYRSLYLPSDIKFLYTPSDIKFLYTFFNGVLRISDWMSSGNLEIKTLFFNSSTELSERIKSYLKSKDFILHKHQEYFKTDFDCGFMRLPTGDGKTETALLANFPFNKVIYTLPTITTVESMRRRFEEYFGKENVSFSHHLLFLTLYDEGRLNEKALHQYSMKRVVVTTIDKVLLSLMNSKHYPMIQMSLNNSYLVVDEIHSYPPFTLSLILNGLEYLKEYHNTKILVMSATLPKIIEEELRERIGAEELVNKEIVEERYKSKKRIRLRKEFINEDIESNLDGILEMFNKGKRVLVVLNTVDKAKRIYELLKNEKNNLKENDEIFIIHSRFNYDDKKKKIEFLESQEQEKNWKRFILIATQIVEVSLNIDFDVMFTEVSPFDSLVQRCGRVNRKGGKSLCDVFLFSSEKYLPYKKEQIEITKEILSSFELETEAEFLTTNDKYYNKLGDFYEKEFDKKPLKDFEMIEKSEFGEILMRTRDGFITVPCIPTGEDKKIYNEVKEYANMLDNLPSCEKDERLKILRSVLGKVVEVPIYVANDLKFEDREIFDRFGVIFIYATYNSTIGIIPNKPGCTIF